MRTVLDEDTCTGRLQLPHPLLQQQLAAKLCLHERGPAHPGQPLERPAPGPHQRPLGRACSGVAMQAGLASNDLASSIDDSHAPFAAQRRKPLQTCPRAPNGHVGPPPAGPAASPGRVGRFQAPSSQYQVQPRDPLAHNAPKVYPNNTLVEDLCKCHPNLWPKSARATSKTVELIKSCLPQEAPTRDNQTDGGRELDGPPVAVVGHGADCVDGAPRPQTHSQPRARVRRRDCKFPMPDSISRLNSTLTQDDYNRALGVLTSDIRFQLHLLLYRRLQTVWVLFSTVLCVFLPLLLSANLETNVILGACSLWLGLQAVGLVLGGGCRRKLDRMLERSVAQVNSYFMDHKLMLGVINVGGLCERSRLVIPLVYFDTFECIEQIESIVSADLKSIEADKGAHRTPRRPRQRAALDYSKIGLHQLEPNRRALAKSQLAKRIVLRFSQRWISQFDRSKLMFTDDRTRPRHLSTGKCLCQFIEEQFQAERCERIKDLDESLDGCRAGRDAPNAPPLSAPNEKVPGTVRQTFATRLFKLNRGKSQQQRRRHAQQQVVKQQSAPRGREPEATTRSAGPGADTEQYHNDKGRSEDQDDNPHRATCGSVLGHLANGLNDKPSQSDGSKGGEPPAGNNAPNNGSSSSNNNNNNHHHHEHQHSCEIFVPSTLSHLVGRVKGRQDSFRANFADSLELGYNSKLVEGFASHLQQERIDSRSSPATDLSLELDCDSLMNRSDELIRKLKLLLASRANEFSRSLEGGVCCCSCAGPGLLVTTTTTTPTTTTTTSASHTSLTTKYYPSSNSTTIICDNHHRHTEHKSSNGLHSDDQTNHQQHDANNDDVNNNNNHGSSINQISKKLFAQTDGLFFMGSKKGRQQQGVYVKPQQRMLEIC